MHPRPPIQLERIVPETGEKPTHEKTDYRSSRLIPLDVLRGLIIVLMALDHAARFVAQKHSRGEYWGGKFPVYDDTLAFLTRLVTHFSAPGFFFLMGAGMVLLANSRRKQGWSEGAIIRHFLLRGGLLIALQVLVVNRAWELSAGGWALKIYLGVLFALGGTMIVSSGLLWIQPRFLLLLTAALFVGTELLVPAASQWNQATNLFNRLLLTPGGNSDLWVSYPILPWLELVTLGMVFGHWLVDDPRMAFKRASRIGGGFLFAFLVARCLDGFGNIRPRAGNSWIDFLNVVKYPPSITFSLLTMGVNLILLALLARASGRQARYLQPMAVFGRVPLFFYLTHLFLYAAFGNWLTTGGTSIAGMYPYWLSGLLVLLPLCLGYGALKHRRPARSVLRFF